MECMSCHGTGRGVFGGPCNNCQGRGQVGASMGFVQIAIVLGIVVVFVIALCSSASAATPGPTVRQATRAIVAYDRVDHPTSITVTRCRQVARSVVCRDVETGVVTDWTLDGQPITMTIVNRTTVRMRDGHPTVTSSYVTHFAN